MVYEVRFDQELKAVIATLQEGFYAPLHQEGLVADILKKFKGSYSPAALLLDTLQINPRWNVLFAGLVGTKWSEITPANFRELVVVTHNPLMRSAMLSLSLPTYAGMPVIICETHDEALGYLRDHARGPDPEGDSPPN